MCLKVPEEQLWFVFSHQESVAESELHHGHTGARPTYTHSPIPIKAQGFYFSLPSFLSFISFSPPPSLCVFSYSAGLKSIMKKNGAADKQGAKGAKKNLKFVGVNGG